MVARASQTKAVSCGLVQPIFRRNESSLPSWRSSSHTFQTGCSHSYPIQLGTDSAETGFSLECAATGSTRMTFYRPSYQIVQFLDGDGLQAALGSPRGDQYSSTIFEASEDRRRARPKVSPQLALLFTSTSVQSDFESNGRNKGDERHTERILLDADFVGKRAVSSLLPTLHCFSVPMVCWLPQRDPPRIYHEFTPHTQSFTPRQFLLAQCTDRASFSAAERGGRNG